MSKSTLELAFKSEWKRIGGRELTEEYKFFNTRKWRFDFVDLETKVAIEIDGGAKGFFKRNKKGKMSYVTGRHQSAEGYKNDCIKLNCALLCGFVVFRLTGDMVGDSCLLREIARHISDKQKSLDAADI